MVSGARVAAVHSALPPAAMSQRDLWDGYFAKVYAGDARAARIWRSAGVRTRYGVVDPREEDVSTWSTGARMRRYAAEAAPLAKEAVSSALAAAGVDARDVGLLTVVSCTGYSTPGLDITVARDLGMPDSVRRLSIGHMGCYAALPGLSAVADYVTARGRVGVLLCCELTSLHLQPALATDDTQQIVTHALFADAAAAVVVVPSPAGLQVVDCQARTDASTADQMTWTITDQGFRMGLSPRVPAALARQVRPAVGDLLAGHGLGVDDVAAWAVHPGGPKILEVVADGLGLPAAAIRPSYDVLSEHGNCSSATVLLVLERLLRHRPPAPGDAFVLLAFGPGLTLASALLRDAGN